jgi:hypothetical protein
MGNAPKGAKTSKDKRTKAISDRRHLTLLLPVSGGQRKEQQSAAEQATNRFAIACSKSVAVSLVLLLWPFD